MASPERPLVNVYESDEDGVEQLVHREMNDEEYEVWQALVAEAPTPIGEEPHPLLAAVETMTDEERQALRDLLKED